jgi:rfaE bifunctional protein nucleotidyltransferase chain/domain
MTEKIWTREKLESQVQKVKNLNKTIVFTNGCFDILHAGHVHYLQETASLADFFIVGVNSDNSVKRLEKSAARPLQNESSRSAVMSALGCVDAVVVFDENTPKEIIEIITPDVLVKGGDYEIKDIVGADWVTQHGGRVTTIEFLPGYSTTAVEKKIIDQHQSNK